MANQSSGNNHTLNAVLRVSILTVAHCLLFLYQLQQYYSYNLY